MSGVVLVFTLPLVAALLVGVEQRPAGAAVPGPLAGERGAGREVEDGDGHSRRRPLHGVVADRPDVVPGPMTTNFHPSAL